MKKKQFKTLAGMLTLSAFLGVAAVAAPTSVMAATEKWNDAASSSKNWESYKTNWSTISSNYENVSLTPGKTESELNFAWYSKTAETPQVRVATSRGLLANYDKYVAKDAKYAEQVSVFSGTQTAIDDSTVATAKDKGYDLTGYYSNKLTVTGLEENTDYYYSVYQDGEWQDVQSYSTHSFSDFSFFYVGDPQIGACKSQTTDDGNVTLTEKAADGDLAARNDSYNWNSILTEALNDHPNVSFLLSAGDQVNTSTNEAEYAGYLGAEVLASLPVSTTIGNHDSTSAQYSYHFNNPNAFTSTDTEYTTGQTAAGTDYYYTYGNVLFIVLDTNNYNCATHENVIKKAISENEDAKWRVVMFHQDIYGSGYDHSDSDGMVLRTQLTPIMDEYDIDVVLQGHDHTYSRTYQLKGDGKSHTSYDKSNYKTDTEFLNQNICYDITSTQTGRVTNPEGTVYLEANSATGSKFYNLIATKQDYISERSQNWHPTYSVIDVSDTEFTVTTYDSETGKELQGSSSYTIVKTDETKTEKKAQTISGKTSIKKAVNAKSFNLNMKTSGDGKLTYSSSNSSVASVSASGKITVKKAGKAVITVKAAETTNYTAAEKKVTITVTPKKATLLKLQASGSKTVKVSWKKDKKVSGYQVVYSYKKNFTGTVKKVLVNKNTKTSRKLTKLKKKTLYVKVRSYKTVNGTRIFGAYSAVKKVKVK